MAKRFTDSDKWKNSWFRKLPVKYKLLWLYMLDTCDHAGFWDDQLDIAEYIIMEDFSKEEVNSFFKGRIEWISDSKLFIPGFIDFQYKELNPNNRAHRSVLELLKKNETEISPLLGASMGLARGMLGCKDKDKDKDKDKVKDKDKYKDKDKDTDKAQDKERWIEDIFSGELVRIENGRA